MDQAVGQNTVFGNVGRIWQAAGWLLKWLNSLCWKFRVTFLTGRSATLAPKVPVKTFESVTTVLCSLWITSDSSISHGQAEDMPASAEFAEPGLVNISLPALIASAVRSGNEKHPSGD